ncbi:MAG: 16S rRNA (adenine(1518)-N(6)/adenine(1519)-N(6))-dimethyltransferase RsmA [Pseudomonadota bacterium]|nr:16S rRNA (adenine(1518)-N(6)/adenine(1519)-N(6))-dimethyltransferase RsmA [Pseudomonadota bacterium]
METQKPRKRFGQNFLHDPFIINRIIKSITPHPGDHFVEIGPGLGAITKPLINEIDELDVIEIDNNLAEELQKKSWAKHINVHLNDVLKFNFNEISDKSKSLRLIGNLPYNISTPILFHFLNQLDIFIDIHVMLQKEVAKRIAAKPGNRDYGRLTVALSAHCNVELLFLIGPGAFNPAPSVESAFTKLSPLEKPLVSSIEQPIFDQIIRYAFGQRRKQLKNALSGVISIDTIKAAQIDPEIRAENLHVEQYAELTKQHLKS